MLQNAVHPEEELRQVKNQADQLQAFHGKGIGYDSYCNLLLSATSNLDAKHAPKGRMGTTKRNVYAHDLGDLKDDVFHYAYNLDSDIGDFQANVHRQQPKDSRFTQSRTLQNSRNPTFSAKGNPQKLCSPSSNGIACNLMHMLVGIYYLTKPRPLSWVYKRILENELSICTISVHMTSYRLTSMKAY